MRNQLPTADIFQIREAIREWVDLLASGDFGKASEFFSKAPGPETHYSAQALQEAIGGYNRQYREAPAHKKSNFLPQVAPPASTSNGGENMVIYCTGDTGHPVIEYDLPLDGRWSDLTAKFLLIKCDGGFTLSLHDIRVL